jgi:hypothetical protein
MKTNILFIIVALIAPLKDYAQTAINKSVAIQPGQKIVMHFDYPEKSLSRELPALTTEKMMTHLYLKRQPKGTPLPFAIRSSI